MNLNILIRGCYIASTFSVDAIVKQRRYFFEKGHLNQRRSYIILQFDEGWILDDLLHLRHLKENNYTQYRTRSILFDP